MTAGDLVYAYERSFSQKPVIFGLPDGGLSPEEDAGNLIKHYGLQRARDIADAKASEFPAAWSHWARVFDILAQTDPQ